MKTSIQAAFILGALIVNMFPLQAKQSEPCLKDSYLISGNNFIHQDSSVAYPAFSVYFELGGKFLPSLNLDYRRSENLAINFGTGFWWDEESPPQMLYIPSISGYYLGGKKHRLEAGGGLGVFIGQQIGLYNMLIFSDFGYRYQKRQALFFRATFNPWMAIPLRQDAKWVFTPWVGISLGYCF